MRAVVFEGVDQPLRVGHVDVAAPGDGEVSVRMTASGVCHTDLHVVEGSMPVVGPHVLGHEGAGVVEAVGPGVSRLRVGDAVVLASVPACGNCWFCIRGAANHCERMAETRVAARFSERGRSVTGFAGLGTFAELLTVPEYAAVRVDSSLPAAQLALIGCGVLTGVGAAVNTACIVPGQTVAVIGCGGVGLSAVQGAKVAGASRIIAIDPLATKRELAVSLGATDVVDPGAADHVEAVRALTGGHGVDAAIEATGVVQAQLQALAAVRRGGTAVLVGFTPRDAVLSFSAQEFLLSGKRLCASIFGGGDIRTLVPRIVSLAEAGRLDLGSLVSRTIDLDDVGDAFERMRNGEVVRSVVAFV